METSYTAAIVQSSRTFINCSRASRLVARLLRRVLPKWKLRPVWITNPILSHFREGCPEDRIKIMGTPISITSIRPQTWTTRKRRSIRPTSVPTPSKAAPSSILKLAPSLEKKVEIFQIPRRTWPWTMEEITIQTPIASIRKRTKRPLKFKL